MKILGVDDDHLLRLEMRGECNDFSLIQSESATKIGEVNMMI
jgi:hypothetical protein